MLDKVFEKYDSVIFFDTETTGLDAEKCRIIELAAILLRPGDNGYTITDQTDMLVKLPQGEKIPEKIVSLTHITDDMLDNEGVSEEEAMKNFCNMIEGKTLLCAYNANFDMNFVIETAIRYMKEDTGKQWIKKLNQVDCFDPLTAYKDRRLFPHRLENAITAYGLEDKVKNSHRAIDDVLALYEVTKALDSERDDLAEYINVFGYNPKYGISGKQLKVVRYIAQPYRNGSEMVGENDILPRT